MTDDRCLGRVRAIVEQVAGPERSLPGAGPDTPLGAEGFWLDSAAMLEVILGCEEEFGIVFDWEGELDAEVLRTVRSLAAAIERKKR
jgi:acyl carrier protein